jgi:apolipoprotein N-acyltransferase
MKLKKKHLYFLSVISGLLLVFGWPVKGFPILLFFGFVPLLLIEDFILQNRERFNRYSFFWYSYISMFIWNLLTTYWIYYSSGFGVTMAVICNSLFMAFVLSMFHYTRTVFKHNSAYLTFIIYWLSFEFLHMHWDLSWSWLNLGNGFSNHPAWIQWYEFTGTLGGSLWVLVAHYMAFPSIKMFLNKERTIKYRSLYAAACSGLIVVPIIISLFIYYNYQDKGPSISVITVQPNIDPYNEKFGGMTSEEQLAKLLKIAKLKIDDKTDLMVGPETAIPEGVWEDKLDNSRSVDSLRNFLQIHPNLNILIGLSSYKMFKPEEKVSLTARRYPYDNGWYDAYNTAMLVDSSDYVQLYHKSILVPGVEKMPFPKLLKPLEKFALDLGGIGGSLGVQDERTVFYSADKKIKAAPVICYESIYGEYVGEYISNGANIICIITNDGWWEDTPGYRQHFSYASLRAIETRRSVVQSANTGISGFINQRGEVIQQTGWWQGDALKQDVKLNDEITYYVKYGDYIARSAYYMSIIFLLYTILLSVSSRLKRKSLPEK